MHKIDEVIFVSKKLKKSVHSGVMDLFFKLFRSEKPTSIELPHRFVHCDDKKTRWSIDYR